MTGSDSQRLMRAVLAVQGAGTEADLTPEEIARARDLVEARRRAEAIEPCPLRARRRAHALFEERPPGVWELLAHLVFDSWSTLAPQARSLGTERLLRFENATATLDVQVAQESASEGATVALAIVGGAEGRTARLEVDPGSSTVPLALDGHGTGSTRLEASTREVVVIVDDEDGELLRTPPVALR